MTRPLVAMSVLCPSDAGATTPTVSSLSEKVRGSRQESTGFGKGYARKKRKHRNHRAGSLRQTVIDKQGRYEEAITLARGFETNTSAYLKRSVMIELGIAFRDASPPLKDLAEARRCFEQAIELGANYAKAELAKLP